MEIIHHHFESLPSTNDWAKKNIHAIPKEALLLTTADEQTAGRGQYGRHWISPTGVNIYASFGFFVDKEHDPLTITHLLAISAAHTLEKQRITCKIKWPNDLMVNQKKIGGILCETAPASWVVVGIGLNVNMDKKSLDSLGQPATSVFAETGKSGDLNAILTDLRIFFSKDLQLFLSKGFTPFLSQFQDLTKDSRALLFPH